MTANSLLIVVPTLNSFRLLQRLVDSLLDQSLVQWRLLVVDGPSSPNHRRWLEKCCAADKRFSWLAQRSEEPGIFGAMNQGFAEAAQDEWLLFWGSDDWAAGPTVLEHAISSLERVSFQDDVPDLIVCRGRYVNSVSGELSRPAVFQNGGLLSTPAYRRALLFGSTPPHQATLFGPGARRHLNRYAPGFCLSADLDYFLQLSRHPGLCVRCLDLELVHMGDAGVSAQQTHRRLQEVAQAYRRAFAWAWWFPFMARYIRRLASLFRR